MGYVNWELIYETGKPNTPNLFWLSILYIIILKNTCINFLLIIYFIRICIFLFFKLFFPLHLSQPSSTTFYIHFFKT